MYDLTGYFIGCKHRSKPCTHGTKAENTTLECLTGEISTSSSYGKINVNSTTFCNTMMVYIYIYMYNNVDMIFGLVSTSGILKQFN